MSTEENREVVRRYFEEFHNKRALSLADQIFSPEMHEPTLSMTRMLTTAFPDYQITIVAQVAQDEVVATVWKGRGTHEGVWMSPIGAIQPSGKSVTWSGTTTVRVREGQVAEVIGTNWDHLGILQQMGALPATAPRSGA